MEEMMMNHVYCVPLWFLLPLSSTLYTESNSFTDETSKMKT